MKKILPVAIIAGAGVSAFAKPGDGIRFANGSMTLRPAVSINASYDSNINSSRAARRDDVIYSITPRMTYNWRRPDRAFDLNASVYYTYSHYSRHDRDNQHSYGQNLSLTKGFTDNWGHKWSLRMSESWRKINANDSITHDEEGIWRDRSSFNYAFALTQRLNRFHWGLHASYSFISYNNDPFKYEKLFGWDSWAAGGELGWAIGSRTDWILTGSYSSYTHKNEKYSDELSRSYSKKSSTWTAQTGFGSFVPDTEKINYRATVGASRHEYGRTRSQTSWTYQLSLNWRFARKWSLSVRGMSYYQPSEFAYGQASKTYTLGSGLTYSMTDRLAWNADLLYRKSRSSYSDSNLNTYDYNYLTARIGANYALARWAHIHAAVSYITRMSSSGPTYTSGGSRGDYDRFRVTTGLTFTY